MPKTILSGGKSQVKGIKYWAPLLIGLLIGVFATWGILALLTHQSFSLTIDLKTQQITFSAGLQLPFPVKIGEDGRTYIEGVPVRAWLESQGYTVTWDIENQEIIATKETK